MVRVGIVGASGYGGVQLVRLLQDHPELHITYLGGQGSTGRPYRDLYPQFDLDLVVEPVDVDLISEKCDVVFLALPNGLAQTMAPELVARGLKVLDLSADYRFKDLETYRSWYCPQAVDWPAADHVAANQTAVYGLPELFRSAIAEASLIGCPGCYPTSALLALAPLLRQSLIDIDTIIIDSKSGASGAGRAAKVESLFAEVDSSLHAYGVAQHRHTPEIEQICSTLTREPVMVQFTPHLVPMVRGIHTTAYATLRDPGLVTEDLLTLYSSFYKVSPWVTILPPRTTPRTKWVIGSNRCLIGLAIDPRTQRVIVLSVIDNLIKGQSGQAVQCLNIMLGLPETLGLPKLGFYP